MIIDIQFMKKTVEPKNKEGWGLLSQLPERTTCTKFNTRKVPLADSKGGGRAKGTFAPPPLKRRGRE